MESFIAAMFVKMLNFLFEFAKKHKLDRGASINGAASEPFVWNGRTYRLITLKISAGSLPSRFTKIDERRSLQGSQGTQTDLAPGRNALPSRRAASKPV